MPAKINPLIPFAIFLLSILITGCSFTQWVGPGSNLSSTPKAGGYRNMPGSHFGGWVNNSWGEKSTIIPVKKDHPPLQGVSVCVAELENAPCAITDESGRFDIYGIPNNIEDFWHIAANLNGYYGLLIPYHPYSLVIDNHPAIEMPSLALEELFFKQLKLVKQDESGMMSFMIIDGILETSSKLPDHSEINQTLQGYSIRYRKVSQSTEDQETFSPWSNPLGYKKGQKDIIYLKPNESPDKSASQTSDSGLAVALNLAPGVYEIETDKLENLLQEEDYQSVCYPMPGTSSPDSSKPYYARVEVIADHITDVRMICKSGD